MFSVSVVGEQGGMAIPVRDGAPSNAHTYTPLHAAYLLAVAYGDVLGTMSSGLSRAL